MQVLVDEWHNHPILYSLLALLLAGFILAGILVALNDIIAYARSLS